MVQAMPIPSGLLHLVLLDLCSRIHHRTFVVLIVHKIRILQALCNGGVWRNVCRHGTASCCVCKPRLLGLIIRKKERKKGKLESKLA